MTTEELKDLEVAKLVDARGTACPGPLLDAKRAIGECAVGAVMEVQSSDANTQIDIQRWCKKLGHEFPGDLERDGFWSIYLRRSK